MQGWVEEQVARGSGVSEVRKLLHPGAVLSARQPLVRLSDDAIVGYEALARIPGHDLSTAGWLARATASGMREAVEIQFLRAALADGLPPGDGMLFVNLSPSLLDHIDVVELLAPVADRIVIELSEQEAVVDYDSLATAASDWQARGAAIAVDDAGAGYASLHHVFRIQPDYVKLDRRVVADLERDRSLRAFVASVVAFGRESGAQVVAEGIETEAQLAAMQDVGVDLVQGYLLARPAIGAWPTISRTPDLRLDPCGTVAEVAEVVCDRLASRGVIPSFYLERDGLLRCLAQRGVWQVLDGLSPRVGITGTAFDTGEMVVAHDVQRSEHYLEVIPGVVAEACVPLLVEGRPVGALNIDSRRPLEATDLAELERCGDLVSRWLGTRTERNEGGPIAALVSASARLERAGSAGAVSHIVLEAAVAISDMPNAMVVERRANGPSVLARGPEADVLLGIDVGELAVFVELVVPSRSCYTAGDEDSLTMVGADALRRAGMRCLAVVPVRPATGPPLLLVVASPEQRRLHTDVIELLELLASQAAGRLETLGHIAELRRQANEDSLTGIGNRTAFSAALDRWQEDRAAGALALVDVDHFKSVNDTHGHLAGDQLLKDLARLLRSAVRPADAVYRLGGDEFAVLLRGAGLREANRVTQRIHEVTAGPLATFGAGISIGFASLLPGEPADLALREADQLLYDAKRRKQAPSRRLAE